MGKHMVEKETIESYYYITKFKIHGHLRHDFNPEGKIRWFIYCVEDIPCKKIIIGSRVTTKALVFVILKHPKVQGLQNTLWKGVLLTLDKTK